jgi:hypothetical protein
MYTRDGLFECVNRGFPYLARGCVVILAMLFVVTAELSASTLEGIVSKRRESIYSSGRSPHWIKSKNPEGTRCGAGIGRGLVREASPWSLKARSLP